MSCLENASKVHRATHEAGHVVTAVLLGKRFKQASIKTEEGSVGTLALDELLDLPARHFDQLTSRERKQLEEWTMIALAGCAAERLQGLTRDADVEDVQATIASVGVVITELAEVTSFVRWLEERVANLLRVNWAAVQKSAQALVLLGELQGKQARRVIEERGDGAEEDPEAKHACAAAAEEAE